ncbi:hypothetical protein AJ78_06768 [Emergomyces pasteurianus Ep9510]|uniref:Diphthine--ammonia ligase n=1 Tax=Emergomyces pasteurianus Ep9510 TaxID=1447872 RepID=A0A1J9P9R8_9EURO|nr:hypothetical protein AJ78_06768 [Emergomyces pasteurianus Ep9510]
MPQQQKLNVIALISGGKDSLYSILHCLRNGHSVVALANLHPPLRPKPSSNYAAYLTAGTLQCDDQDGDVVQKGPGGIQGVNGDGALDQRQEEEEEEEEEEENEEEEEDEDIHSYMYQTVGHSIIPLYQSALGIPLYRAPIHGTALNTSRDYQTPSSSSPSSSSSSSTAEEIESLFHLLQQILKAHPTANAVSAGAILSTYQRTRIENVASRLGLLPLAWLWMYPTLPPPAERAFLPPNSPAAIAGLLEDMAACGCEARIIKVASGGLDVEDLWGDVAGKGDGGVVRRRLVKGMGRFVGEGEVQGAVLGEGGEYETIALDGPRVLWKAKIVVGRIERRIGEWGVAAVRIKEARCERKEVCGGDGGLGLVRVPQLFDAGFKGALDEILLRPREDEDSREDEFQKYPLRGTYESWNVGESQAKGDTLWTISNLSAPEVGPGAGNQMKAIVQKIQNTFLSSAAMAADAANSRTPADIVFATVLLRSMDDFQLINPIYASLFTKPNPPARVTLACGDNMPPGVDILASIVIDMLPRECRLGLHVQSRSYWAPANIGPYSQAQSIPLHADAKIDRDGGLIYIAGQIPLDPASMELYSPRHMEQSDGWFTPFVSRSVLALQHLWRIGRALQADWWLGAVAFLAGDENISLKAKIAWNIWEHLNRDPSSLKPGEDCGGGEDDDETPAFDTWDLKYGNRRDLGNSSLPKGAVKNLPNFEIIRGSFCTPPLFAVQVAALPRASDIEWQGLGARSGSLTTSEETQTDRPWRLSHSQGDGVGSFYYIGIQDVSQSSQDLETCIRDAIDFVKAREINFHGDNVDHVNSTVYAPYRLDANFWQLGQIVPCKSVWGPKGKRLAAGIVVHVRSKK